MSSHLVIGDPHAQAGVSNDRFDWLGRLILDRRPDKIICLGDFADMESLSSYDKGRKDFEGRRLQVDIDATKDALHRINRPVDEYNEQCRRNKKAIYKPEKSMLGGNHDEGRINRLIQLHSELDGVISVRQLGYEDFGWDYVPYGEPVCVDGVWYCHHFPSGVKGEPIGGVNIGASLLAKNMASSCVGHNHMFDCANRSRPDGKRMWGVSAGCYFEHSMKYARTMEHLYWRGVVFFHNVDDGDFDIETIQIQEIKKRYA